jgi:quinol monooxygenase YgiN
MVIIAGYLTLQPTERQAFIDSHRDLVQRARAYSGCLDVAISPDPIEPDRVNMIEIWRSEEDLQAWRKVADGPDTGVEFNDDHVLKYEISRSGPPF